MITAAVRGVFYGCKLARDESRDKSKTSWLDRNPAGYVICVPMWAVAVCLGIALVFSTPFIALMALINLAFITPWTIACLSGWVIEIIMCILIAMMTVR